MIFHLRFRYKLRPDFNVILFARNVGHSWLNSPTSVVEIIVWEFAPSRGGFYELQYILLSARREPVDKIINLSGALIM